MGNLPRTADGRLTLDRWLSSDRMPTDPEARLRLQYMGVLSLLGRVSRKLPMHDDDRYGIERAMVDANVLMRQLKTGVYFEHASGNGYAMFERPTDGHYADRS